MLARDRFHEKVISITHLPSVCLMIGYILFWIELFAWSHPSGHTTWTAWSIFALLTVFLLIKDGRGLFGLAREALQAIRMCSLAQGVGLVGSLFIIVFILVIALYASTFPPHLVQEFDTLNYHITLPRQHLILGSFRHLTWSSGDLLLLPVDYALAPYWLATTLPNKYPQYIFIFGLLAVSMRIVRRLHSGKKKSLFLVLIAICASHNISIQMGTAMLDIVLCYLFIAALDSFMEKKFFMAAIEFSFYFWSKSFIPLQCLIIAFMLWALVMTFYLFSFQKIGWHINRLIPFREGKRWYKYIRKYLVFFLITSLVIGGPFVMKSIYYTATPLYPFFPGVLQTPTPYEKDSALWHSILEKSAQYLGTKDQYGSGRGIMEFIKHIWLVAVPEKGVNNRYDYPLGLTYLLCLGPFLYMLWQGFKRREIYVLPLLVLVFWGVWWLGSHQSRFLFIPLVLMIICVCSYKKFHTGIFLYCLSLTLCVVAISLFRCHLADFGRTRYEVLRPRDKELLAMSPPRNPPEPACLTATRPLPISWSILKTPSQPLS